MTTLVTDDEIERWPTDAQFQLGDLVQKKGRASWRGKVVGWYRTELTALGLAVESSFEPGSVQIYPQTALEAWQPAASDRDVLVKLLGLVRKEFQIAHDGVDFERKKRARAFVERIDAALIALAEPK